MSKVKYFIPKTIVLLVLTFILWECGNVDISKSFSGSEANRLLSNDTTKVWTLMARSENGNDVYGECINDRTLTFVMAATDSLYMLGKPVNCSEQDVIDTLYKADYEVLTINDDFSDSLNLTNEQFTTIGILHINELTSQTLRLSYTEDGIKIIERYDY